MSKHQRATQFTRERGCQSSVMSLEQLTITLSTTHTVRIPSACMVECSACVWSGRPQGPFLVTKEHVKIPPQRCTHACISVQCNYLLVIHCTITPVHTYLFPWTTDQRVAMYVRTYVPRTAALCGCLRSYVCTSYAHPLPIVKGTMERTLHASLAAVSPRHRLSVS